MTEERTKRKLCAVLSADAKGYSRLMGQDEAGTVNRLKEYRNLMIDLIKNYRGRVVDSPGDNILAEFASVVDATECSVKIQEELEPRNVELPEDMRMQFRIGINLGDVIEDGERIYGDGVNIAARIESLSDKGGICISGTVYDQVKYKLPLRYEYQGEQIVKNIKEPIRLYKVLMEKDVDELSLGERLELPEKPSIAVLPFVNMSADPEQEYFSDGITEEIITGLSKVPHLFVIARNSVFTYKGKTVKVQQVGRELGVGHVLEGSVRKSGNRVRISVQLVDATTGHHQWADRYDRELKDIFNLQDEITLKVLTAVQVKLTEGEQGRTLAKGTDNIEAYIKFLKGRVYAQRSTKNGFLLAQQMAKEAISLDPEYPGGYRLLGMTYLQLGVFGWSKSPDESIARAAELFQKALTMDESDSYARCRLGYLYTLERNYEKAIAEGELTITREPNSSDAHAFFSATLIYAGRKKEAIRLAQKAIHLNPIPLSWQLQNLGLAYTNAGMYEEALLEFKKALHSNPNYIRPHIGLAVCYSLLGREEEARAAVTGILEISPKFSLKYFAKIYPFKNQEDMERFTDALSKVGLK